MRFAVLASVVALMGLLVGAPARAQTQVICGPGTFLHPSGICVSGPEPAAPPPVVYVQQPVAPAPVVYGSAAVYAPGPVVPVVRPGNVGARVERDTRSSLFLLGLGLVGVGLVSGGAGLAILYYCPTGSTCYSDALYYTGWALAAPGLIPLAIGALLVYITTDGGRGRRAAAPTHRNIANWGVSATPTPGGAFVSAGFVF